MKPNSALTLIAALLLLAPGSSQAATGSPEALALADQVMKAAGSENWPKVSRIQFVFEVSEGDKVLVSAKHNWDLREGMDHVVWADNDFQVDVRNPPSGELEKAAYQRWVNDTYWLLMPLKLKDSGVKLERLPDLDENGKLLNVLQLSFQGVGLTPGDVYTLHIDPATYRVVAWVYQPNPEKQVPGTWEDYVEAGGLTISTSHQLNDKKIQIKDLVIETSDAPTTTP